MAGQCFDYFPHGADIGIIGRGETLEDCFEAAAEAVFALMADLSKVKPERTIQLQFRESDREIALVVWLNRLIAESKALGMVLCQFRLQRLGDDWTGDAHGEPWHRDLEPGVEVKGATLTMLSVAETEEGWEARCVVDV